MCSFIRCGKLCGPGVHSFIDAASLYVVNVLVIEYGYVCVPELFPSRSLRGADRNCSDGQENGTVVPGLPVPDKYTRTSTSIPQPGLDNRTSVLYTGAVVGGGTVVNGMFFNRGSAADYDAWERLGNPGWGWKDLLPYFKKVSFPGAEEQLVRMVD